MIKGVKPALQSAIRRAHLLPRRRCLSSRVAIYFHSLERKDHDAFGRVIESIRYRGFELVASTREFLAHPGRVAWISFDDNYVSWLESMPLLEKLDVRATFYLNTAPLRDMATQAEIDAFYERIDHHGDRTPLSSDEVRAIGERGHVIGSHTHEHRALNRMPIEAAIEDVRTNMRIAGELSPEPVRDFAIPFGMRRFFPPSLGGPLHELGLETIAFAIPAMQHEIQTPEALHRSPWRFDRSIEDNWADLEVDGRQFERLTGRSAVG